MRPVYSLIYGNSCKSSISSYMRKRNIPSLSHIIKRSIFINTETTPNPQSMKFLPGK